MRTFGGGKNTPQGFKLCREKERRCFGLPFSRQATQSGVTKSYLNELATARRPA